MKVQGNPIGDVRPLALRFVNEVGKIANKKWTNAGMMAVIVTSEMMRVMITSYALKVYERGSEDGLELILNFYDGARKDAIENWKG